MRRTCELKMAGAQRALCYWTCVTLAFGFIGKTSAVSASYDQVVQACAQCDSQFSLAALAYQNKFGVFSTAIDGAKFHCRNMANVSQCYTNCQAGSIYTYSSNSKEIFDLFYRDYCDPACYTAIMPFCYLKTFGTFENSLTCSGDAMNIELRECLKTELFEKQNCSYACTPGQRKALFLFMQLQIPCFFSYTTQVNCYTSVQYCTERHFGDAGSDYTDLTDPILANSNNASCKQFSTEYIDCLENALSGSITFGESSSMTTYDSPCASRESQIVYLEQFTDTFLAAPFCHARNATLNGVCRAFVSTTTERVASTATATARSTPTVTTTFSTERTRTTTGRTPKRTERTTSAALAMANSTPTITTANIAVPTLTYLTSPMFTTANAGSGLQIDGSTTVKLSATNRDQAYSKFDKETVFVLFNLKNSAVMLTQLPHHYLCLLVSAWLLLIYHLVPVFF